MEKMVKESIPQRKAHNVFVDAFFRGPTPIIVGESDAADAASVDVLSACCSEVSQLFVKVELCTDGISFRPG